MLTWSMTATSPGRRRLTRCLVRSPSRAVPSIGASGPHTVATPEQSRKATATGGGHPPRLAARQGGGRKSRAASGRKLRRRRLAARGRGGWPPRRSARRRACGGSPRRRPRRRAARRRRGPPATSFSSRKWASASEATWGRWVMQIDLAPLAQRPQPLADDPGRVAADPGVDLVEDERAGAGAALAEPAQRQHHPRELAAGGRVAQRRRLDAGVGRHPQLDRLAPAGAEAVGCGSSTTSSVAPGIASRSSSVATFSSSGLAAAARPALSFPPRSARRASASASAASASAPRSSALSRRSISARQRSAWASTDSTLPPCLRSSRSSASSRSSTASSAPGRPRPPRRSRAARRRRRPARPRAPRAARRSRRGRSRRRRRPAAALRPGPARRRPAAVLVGPGQPGVGARPPPRAGPRRGAGARARPPAPPLLGVRRDLLDLGELVAVEVEVALARPVALAQLGQLGGEPPALPVRLPVAAPQLQVLGAGKPVEHLHLRRGDRQLAVLVLPVEGEQPAAQQLQVRRRRGPAGDERAGPPARGDPPPQHDLLGPLGQPLGELGHLGLVQQPLGQVEDPLDPGLLRPRPNDLRLAPCRPSAGRASGPARSSRPRSPPVIAFSPFAEAQLGPLDQQQVLDPQLAQHWSLCSNGGGPTLPRVGSGDGDAGADPGSGLRRPRARLHALGGARRGRRRDPDRPRRLVRLRLLEARPDVRSADAEAVRLPYAEFVKPGVRLLRETVVAIDPAARAVTTDAGNHEADVPGRRARRRLRHGRHAGPRRRAATSSTRWPAPNGWPSCCRDSTAGGRSSASAGRRSSARRRRARPRSCSTTT